MVVKNSNVFLCGIIYNEYTLDRSKIVMIRPLSLIGLYEYNEHCVPERRAFGSKQREVRQFEDCLLFYTMKNKTNPLSAGRCFQLRGKVEDVQSDGSIALMGPEQIDVLDQQWGGL